MIPNIKIAEKDTSILDSDVDTKNVVYIPGYAIQGPLNEPVLCASLTQFKKVFGVKPYQFKNAQNLYGTDGFYKKGDYERSYIMAYSILQQGLPVLFERFESLTSGSSLPVAEKNFTSFIITDDASYADADIANEFVFKANRVIDKYSKVIMVDAVVTEDTSPQEGKVYYTQSGTQGSFVYTKFTGSTFVSGTNYYEIAKTYYNRTDAGEYSQAVDLITENSSYEKVIGSYTQNINTLTITLGNDTISAIITSTTKFTINSVEYTNNNDKPATISSTLKIKAKYAGLYGNHIKVLATITNSLLKIVVTDELSGEKEIIFLSADENSDRYYANLLNSFELVNIEWDGNTNLPGLGQENYLEATFSGDEFIATKFIADLKDKLETDIESKTKLSDLSDRNLYNIKFITTGAYSSIYSEENIDLFKNLINTAVYRADAIALITYKKDLSITQIQESYDAIIRPILNTTITRLNNVKESYGTYASAFLKHKTYSTDFGNQELPAVFGYLRNFATSVKTYPDYYAMSGTIRGLLSDIIVDNTSKEDITGAQADLLLAEEGIGKNPILNIRPYGYCVWGNRTLFDTTDLDLSYGLPFAAMLNIRVMLCDIKKIVFEAATKYMYEPNTDILWLNFISAITPTLDKMVSSQGLYGYKFEKVIDARRNALSCNIIIYPISAVDKYEITVDLRDSTVEAQ